MPVLLNTVLLELIYILTPSHNRVEKLLTETICFESLKYLLFRPQRKSVDSCSRWWLLENCTSQGLCLCLIPSYTDMKLGFVTFFR